MSPANDSVSISQHEMLRVRCWCDCLIDTLFFYRHLGRRRRRASATTSEISRRNRNDLSFKRDAIFLNVIGVI